MPAKEFEVGGTVYEFPDSFSDEKVQGILTQQGIIKSKSAMGGGGKGFFENLKSAGRAASGAFSEFSKGFSKTLARDMFSSLETSVPMIGVTDYMTGGHLKRKVNEATENKGTLQEAGGYGATAAELLIPAEGVAGAFGSRTAKVAGKTIGNVFKDLSMLEPELKVGVTGAKLRFPHVGSKLKAAYQSAERTTPKPELKARSAGRKSLYQRAEEAWIAKYGKPPSGTGEKLEAVKAVEKQQPPLSASPSASPASPSPKAEFASHKERNDDLRKQFFSIIEEKGLNAKAVREGIKRVYGKGYSELSYEERSALQRHLEKTGSLPDKPDEPGKPGKPGKPLK
jgi:hypothetical protein